MEMRFFGFSTSILSSKSSASEFNLGGETRECWCPRTVVVLHNTCDPHVRCPIRSAHTTHPSLALQPLQDLRRHELPTWQLFMPWPRLRRRHTAQAEDLLQLQWLLGTRQDGPPREQLTEHTARRPHIDGFGVVRLPQQQLRCSIPQRHHPRREWTLWQRRACQAPIRDLQLVVPTNQ